MPTPDVLFEVFVYSGLLPAALAAAILLLALRFGPRRAEAAERIAGAAALGGGFLAGYAVQEWAPLKPVDPWHWLPYLALLAGAVGLVELAAAVPWAVRWGLRVLVAAAAAWLLVPSWPDLEAVRPHWLATVGGSVLCLWAVLDPLARRQPGASFPLLLLLVAMAGGAALELSGNGKLAQLAGVLAATLGGCAVVSWWYPQRSPVQGMVPGVAVLLPGLLLDGYLYAFDVPLTSFLLLVTAPLALGVSVLPPFRALKERGRLLVQTVAVLVPVGLAVIRIAAP
jgi:hypothetical protein